jgi:hypothetical protein
MQLAWIILPRCVTFQDLQSALSSLGHPVDLGAGPAPTQMMIKASTPGYDSRIQIEEPETIAELEQEDEQNRINAVVPDPLYYRYRYYDRDGATQVLKTIASSRLADGPMLITDGGGWYRTGPEFLQRLEQDPEWWDWWRRQGT